MKLYNVAAHQIPVEHPVGMEVMDPIQNLIQEGLHHPSGQLHGLLVGLGGAVELDDVLPGREHFQLGLFLWSEACLGSSA